MFSEHQLAVALKSLYEDGEIEFLLYREEGESIGPGRPDVKVVHVPTGTEVARGDCATQVQNQAAALLELTGVLFAAQHR